MIGTSTAQAGGGTYIRNGNIYTKENTWIAEAGVAGATDLLKEQKHNASPLLNFGYHGEDLNVDFGSANYRFLGSNNDMLNMSFFFASSGLAYDQDDSPKLSKMEEREISFDMGLNADLHLSQGTLSTYFQHDVSGTYKGYITGINYFYPMTLGRADIVPFVGISYVDEDYVNYYFGIRDNEVNAERPAYQGRGDVTYNLGYKFVMPLSDNWSLTQTTAYARLGDNISDSPIVDSANQWTVGATVAYYFSF